MDEMVSPCSSPNSANPTLQQRLQFILHNRPEWWAYSIFWQPSKDITGNLVFTWRDGHFRGSREFVARSSKTGGGGGGQLISFKVEGGNKEREAMFHDLFYDELVVNRMEGGDFMDLEG